MGFEKPPAYECNSMNARTNNIERASLLTLYTTDSVTDRV